MAFTVTATQGGASAQGGTWLLVRVLANATETGGATSGSNSLSGATPQGSLTPNFSGSWVGYSVSEDGVTTALSAASNNTNDSSTTNAVDLWAAAEGHYSGTVTAGTPLTYGCAAGSGADHSNWCAYEIPASGGTPTVDGSSPALASTTAHTLAVTTASFTPPAGSVLVALIAAGGTGAGAGITITMSDTSGLGLVWTRRAVSSTSDNFQPTFIFTATMPGGAGAGPSPAAWQYEPPPFLDEDLDSLAEDSPAPGWPDYPPDAGPPQIIGGAATLAASTSLTGATTPPYIAGISGSGTAGYFIDQHGQPRMLLLEQAWALPSNAGRWNSGNWQSDMDTYFSTRAGQGYTAWFGTAWSDDHVDSTALSGGRTWDGIYPIVVNGTPGKIATGSETITLNNSFWTRIDYLIASALKNGITVWLNLGMQYDFTGTNNIWFNLSTTQANTFGQLLAARYPVATYPNLQWFFGDDGSGGQDTFFTQMVSGLATGGDTRVLISTEQLPETNSHIQFNTGAVYISGGFGMSSSVKFDWNYTYDPTYLALEKGYTESGTTLLPQVYGDGIWYGDEGTTGTHDYVARRVTWWALSSGARGWNVTSGPTTGGDVWQWQANAIADLTSDPNGTWITSRIGAVFSYFTGLTDWYKLIPDTGNAFITAGRGTKSTNDAPGFNTPKYGDTDNYVSGSITPSGSLAVVYCGQHFSITIDQTKLGAGYTATWVDPWTLATTSATTGSTYNSTPLGNNSQGGPDWVLVFQGPATAAGTATLAAATSLTAPALTLQAPATVTAAAALTAPGMQQAAAVLTAAAAVNSPLTSVLAPAVLQAQASITSPVAAQLATAALTAQAVLVSPPAQLAAPAVLSAATALSDSAVLLAPAVLAAAAQVTANPAGSNGANLAALGVITPAGVLLAPATLAVAGSLSAPAVQQAGAVLAAQATVSAAATQRATAVLAAAVVLSASQNATGSALLAAGMVLSSPAGQQLAPAVLAAAAALTAGADRLQALAVLAAGTGLSAPAVLAAAAHVTAQAAITAPGQVAAPLTFDIGAVGSGPVPAASPGTGPAVAASAGRGGLTTATPGGLPL